MTQAGALHCARYFTDLVWERSCEDISDGPSMSMHPFLLMFTAYSAGSVGQRAMRFDAWSPPPDLTSNR